MVFTVLSLPQVLHEARRHSVDEIAIERGEPVTFHGEQGALVLGEALGDTEISEALSQVLAPEQQADLAVAGVVEFYVEGYAEWSLVAETAEDGVIIRGRLREGDSPTEVGAPLELPPLRPFEPERGGDIPASADSVLHQREHRATRWDMGIADAYDLQPPSELDRADVPPPDRYARTPASLLLDDEDEDAIDFALVAPALVDGELPTLRASGPHGPDFELGHETTGPKVRGTRRRPAGRTTLAAHAEAIEPGTIVYLSGTDLGESLLEHLVDGFEIIDDDTWATVTIRPLCEMPLGRGYLVRLEDPSRCLPWLLRRVEEGSRIVVEGRARTSVGARRTLLGAEATPHLVQWLDAHPQQWLYPDAGGWRVELL